MLRFRYTITESDPKMRKHDTFLALALALTPTTAYAYLDPGTGSFILQMLIATFLGAFLYVRLAWDRTRLFFTRLFSPSQIEDIESDQDTDDSAASQ